MWWLIIAIVLIAAFTLTTGATDGKRLLAKRVVQEWGEKVSEYSKPYSIHPAVVLAMIAQESAGDPNAQNPGDPSRGLMQITPPVVDEYKKVKGSKSWLTGEYYADVHIDEGFLHVGKSVFVEWDSLYVPEINLAVGIWYLNEKIKQHGTIDRAVIAYNGSGPKAELHWQRVRQYLEIIENEKLI